MDGLLLVDKPQGMTSHDVVARVRRVTGIRAIGHAGTLDPFATGLLILCIGHATRLSEYLIGETKAYTGRMKLGERTNTDDVDGEVVEWRPVHVSVADLERVHAVFSGELLQVPPQYSAIQIGGRRAYKMARQGETVDLPARPVQVEALELVFANEALSGEEGARTTNDGEFSSFVDLRVVCSAGTYIRALARDIGEALGCGAHLTALRRVQSGPFTLEEAVTLDQLQQAASAGWQRFLLPMDRAVQHLPPVRLDDPASQRLIMGQWIALPGDQTVAGLCRVYESSGRFVAIGEVDATTSVLKPLKVFHNRG
jgi:tRNA pseudouridine55 synthase